MNETRKGPDSFVTLKHLVKDPRGVWQALFEACDGDWNYNAEVIFERHEYEGSDTPVLWYAKPVGDYCLRNTDLRLMLDWLDDLERNGGVK